MHEADVADHQTEVLIVGGGPVGLSLALHLDALGVRCTLFEQEATTRWSPKGNTNNARTMELLRRLDLIQPLRKLGLPGDHPFDAAYFTRLSTFEITRGRTPSQDERLAERNRSPPTEQVVEPPYRVNQMFMERLLYERAAASANVTLLTSCRATGFHEDGGGVVLHVEQADGVRATWRGTYLVGCDGSRGLVRRTLGIRYEGETVEKVFMTGRFTTAHLHIPDLYPRFMKDRRAWMYMTLNPDTRAVLITLNGVDEFMMHVPMGDAAELSEAAVVQRIHRMIGAEIPIEVISLRPWNAGSFLVAESYGRGRVLLAGDAVHLFTPNGGYGLNTGVDDTANLAWKLAAMIQGWGGPRLIESYEIERRPIAIRNTSVARGMGKAWLDPDVTPTIEEDSPAGEKARAEAAEWPIVRENHFVLPEARDYLGVILGGRYDDSPIVAPHQERPDNPYEVYRPSDIPGGRTPHFWVGDGRGYGDSLYDRFGRGLTLLCLGEAGAAGTEALEAIAAERKIPLKVLAIRQPAGAALYRHAFYVVRPDLYIAWAGDSIPEDLGEVLDLVTGHAAKS